MVFIGTEPRHRHTSVVDRPTKWVIPQIISQVFEATGIHTDEQLKELSSGDLKIPPRTIDLLQL